MSSAPLLGPLWHEVTGGVGFAVRRLRDAAGTVLAECVRLRVESPAARAASMATVAVVLAVITACAMHLPDIWWAAISAFMAAQPTRHASLERTVRRIAGTAVGAALAILSVGWLAYDPVACSLALFAVTMVGAIGLNVSRYGMAWLFVAITFCLVLIISLADPLQAFTAGAYRTIEVTVGAIAAVVAASVLAPDAVPPAASFPGWSDLLGHELPITLHAIRTGLAVALMSLLWRVVELPGVSQVAITLVAVMATPVLSDLHETHQRVIVKGLDRLLGCVMGGLLALVVLGLGLNSLPPWLLALSCCIWLCAYVQFGSHDATYVGTQAGIVVIMTMVQGSGPPDSITPGVQRFAGIFIGLAVLFSLMLIIAQPKQETAAGVPSA